MTQTAERPVSVPLTNPVPGAWIQLSDPGLPPVYVPFEAIYEKDEKTKKDKIVGYAPGAHVKRLLSENASYAAPPAQASEPGQPSMEDQLHEALRQIAELKAQLGASRVSEIPQLREQVAQSNVSTSDNGTIDSPREIAHRGPNRGKPAVR